MFESQSELQMSCASREYIHIRIYVLKRSVCEYIYTPRPHIYAQVFFMQIQICLVVNSSTHYLFHQQPLGLGAFLRWVVKNKHVGKACGSTRHRAESQGGRGGGVPCLPAVLKLLPTFLTSG